MLSAATSVSRGGAINVFTTSNDARLTKKASRPRAQRYEAVNGAGDEAQQKPVKLLVALINATTRRGDLVLGISQDPSSFITAAERTGRPACVIAKQPNAVDVAIRHWQAVTGLKATHAESGLLFDVLAQTRSHENF
jgi:DNA modification methylase